jgi:hypothetical protein
MSVTSLLLPLFIQVGLTFVLMAWMWRLRIDALKGREVTFRDIALRQPAWPARATQVGNAFHNQLELPFLFYVLVALILITRTNDVIFVVLAWGFVIARLLHAFIHTGSNVVPRRFYAMAASAIILFVMWVIFALRILSSGA